MRTTEPKSRRPRQARGFSITELIVVLSILFLFIAIVFPVLRVLAASSRVEAGLNVVGMSADVARQWVSFESWSKSSEDPVQHEQYNGTAALYTPTGEIRLLSNNRNARADSGIYLEDNSAGGALTDSSPLAFNGYRDISGLDYIRIPSGVGVLGIRRTTAHNTNGIRFIAPPFAIAFNENGQMNFGDANGLIYYDGNGNGRYDITQGRPGNYDPAEWDGVGATDSAAVNTTTLVRNLPFEAIECVPGVLVYDANAFGNESFGGELSNGGAITMTSTAGQWLRANGRVLLFSPQTGIALRDEIEE